MPDMAPSLNLASAALLATAAVAFARRWGRMSVGTGALFMAVALAATWLAWWPESPVLGTVVLALGWGVPAVGLLLYGIDLVWAPFRLEMTYVAQLRWVLWPALVLANFAGLAAR
jgi:hypothetical protein